MTVSENPVKPRVLIFGREPAMISELIASTLLVLHLFLLPGLDEGVQAAINAVVVAAASVYTAWKVQSDQLLPLLVGFFKVVITLIVTLGVTMSEAQQAALLTLMSMIAGLFVRGAVDAPVDANGHRKAATT
jgi:hypothetical protein